MTTKLDNNRVLQLLIYHTRPGKAPALESIFRDASKVMAGHGINVVGFWVPNEDPVWKDTFIYVVAHPEPGRSEKRTGARFIRIHSFSLYIEAAKPLLDKVGNTFRVDERWACVPPIFRRCNNSHCRELAL